MRKQPKRRNPVARALARQPRRGGAHAAKAYRRFPKHKRPWWDDENDAFVKNHPSQEEPCFT